MSNELELELEKHLRQYPDCTEETCPHIRNYLAKVIFKQPDNGFIATVQAFNKEQAIRVIKRGVRQSHPHLDLRSVEVHAL